MKIKYNLDLSVEYAKTELWLYDNPVHQPNHYCSRCKERLYDSETIGFTIERFDKMPLEFEYHEACEISGLIERFDAMKKGLLKYKAE